MSMSHARRRWMFRLGAPALLALATGCAAGVGGASGAESYQNGSGKDALLQRAKAYWAANLKNDNVAAWKYEEVSTDPAWTLEGYLKRGGVVYDAVEVREVKQIEGDRAKVSVWMRYSVPLLRIKGKETLAEEDWKLVNGQWFHARKVLQ